MKTRLRVKEVTQEKGLSMTQLHKMSDVAYGTIRKIFHNPYTEITLTTLNRLAQALDVETKDLIESVPDEANNAPTP
jgi:DNA-binding Xre family transcriptional regulator